VVAHGGLAKCPKNTGEGTPSLHAFRVWFRAYAVVVSVFQPLKTSSEFFLR
jgi:hypothetical protein